MDSNKVQVHNNEQEKVVTEKNVSPQNEGSLKSKMKSNGQLQASIVL